MPTKITNWGGGWDGEGVKQTRGAAVYPPNSPSCNLIDSAAKRSATLCSFFGWTTVNFLA